MEENVKITKVENGLYIGNIHAASSSTTLREYEITHVISLVEEEPVFPADLTVFYINIEDSPESDIFQYLDRTYRFIVEGLSKGAVLVHCFYGVSRSGTIITAFIMKKYSLSYKETINKLRNLDVKPEPNPGFADQLRLYCDMEWNANVNSVKYKVLRMRTVGEKVVRTKKLTTLYQEIVRPDPLKNSKSKLDKFSGNFFSCKSCSRKLADEQSMIMHFEMKRNSGRVCYKTFFVLPITWMVVDSMFGDLHCPDCETPVGGFDWVKGYTCACHYEMIPAFYFVSSAVTYQTFGS